MSLESKDATCVGSLCERANSHGTRDFAGDTDLQAPFRNVGARLKIIIMSILPESKRNELKYSLKIAFMFLTIIVKLPVPNLVYCLKWSLVRDSGSVFIRISAQPRSSAHLE